MARRYTPIRPWSPGPNQQKDDEAVSSFLEPKRRRVGVSIACNECRRKRIRCDGRRPTCLNCRGKPEPCLYRDESMSPDARELVVEVVQALTRLPTPDAIQTLKDIKDETDPLRIMSALRDKTGTPSNHDGADATEIVSQNPSAYPEKPPLDTSRSGNETHRELIEPHHENSHERRRFTPGYSPANLQRASSSSGFDSSTPGGSSGRESSSTQRNGHELCDSRLGSLHIGRWTDVDIDDGLAARCISLYLVTDHPLLGHFDPELFISDLVNGREDYCSSLLVNALLYWASQMYSAIDDHADQLALGFCTEAERHWLSERENGNDSTLNIAAAEFLSLGYLGQGRDHSVLKYLKEAANMCARMGLFVVGEAGDDTRTTATTTGKTPPGSKVRRAQMYAAWGAFNWLTLMSLFYHQPGMICPASSPTLPIPVAETLDTHRKPLPLDTERVPSPPFMGDTFPYSCLFWDIVREVSWVYHAEGQLPWGSRGSLAFAEFKFRELLAWSNRLPRQMTSIESNPHHVHVLHLWLHAAILDVFRPFINDSGLKSRRLRTFANAASTPRTVFDISTSQLKRLITSYRVHYASSSYSILWHTALIYVANELLDNTKDEDWYAYLLLCLYGYERLGRSWRVAKAISTGLLSMAMKRGDLSSSTAYGILNALGHRGADYQRGDIRATFMLDLKRSRSEPATSTVEHLAQQFEDNSLISDYTHVFDKEPN